MSSIEAEKQSVIGNLRACLISAQDGIPAQNLNRDYRELIGENIPFRRLGYRALEEFLGTLSDIDVQLRGSSWYVTAKANKNTAGLISLVQGQKRSIPRRRAKARNVNIKSYNQPRYRRRPSGPTSPKWPVMKINLHQNEPMRTVTFKDENRNVRIETAPTIINKPSPPILKHSVSLDNPIPSKLSNRLQKNKSSPDIQKSITPNQQSSESKLSIRLKQAQSKGTNEGMEPPDSRNVSAPVIPTRSSPPSALISTPPRQSAQSRLEKTKLPSLESKLRVVVDTQEGNKSCFYQNKLSQYVVEKNWPKEPSYVVYKQQSGKRQQTVCFACTVRVAIPRQSSRLPEEIFECSTFPVDFIDQAQSKEHAAELALNKLNEREGLLNSPIEEDPRVIVERIKKFLENKECGIWAQKIEDEYKIMHKQLLPDYWVDIVKVSEQFETEKLGPSYIIRSKDGSVTPSPLNISKIPELIHPTGTTWDVFITAGKSVTNVHLRFIGDEYSTRFDMFKTSFNSWYDNTSNHVQPVFSVGEYCAAYCGKAWWRVIITNWEGDFVRVKFIDHGDEEKIYRTNLFKLDTQFYKLPAQAISISLKGLEEFAGRKESEDFINTSIIGKSLVAVVESSSSKNISLTLYDTSKEEATNLNESLKHLFELDYKAPPHLVVGSVYEMTVTNIDEDGIVYVQIFNDGLSLLHEIIDLYFDIDFESVKDYSQISKNRMYLAYKQEDSLYYRVRPISNSPVDNKVQVYCIDYGKYCDVFLEDLIFMEESGSYILNKVPGQAIRTTLHDIPPSVFTSTIRNKLTKFVYGDNSPVIVGRVRAVNDGIPVVELFQRTVPSNFLVSINQTLVVEENISLTKLNLQKLSIVPEKIHPPSVLPISISNSVSPTNPKRTTELMTKILTVYPIGAIERVLSQNRPELPDIDGYFNVYVNSSASPSHFLINPSDFVNSLNKVMDEMNSYYNTNKVQTILEEGSLCAAKDGNFWYRAYIDKVIDHDNISVKVLDYGCVKIISSSNVKPLLDIFTKHPYIGFTAKIHGIVPAHGDWSVEDTITMRNLTNKKNIRSKLKDIILNKQGLGGMTLSLELYVMDNTGQEIHLAEHFVRHYNARFE